MAVNSNALNVLGNIYASNSISTTNVFATLANISGTANVQSLLVGSNIGIGTTAGGNTMSVLGNIYASNSITTTNIVAVLANITTLNVGTLFTVSNITTLNTIAIYGQSGYVGISTSTNLGAALQVQGNIYASNALTSTNLVISGSISYNEDLVKRGPYLTPSAANSATITAWISATCNASSQPTKSWWATSPKPVYGNVAAGPYGTTDYAGSVLLPDGRVLFVPQNSSNVGFFNPMTGLFTTLIPEGLGTITGQFRGGVLVPSGNVVFIPYNSSNIGLFNPLSYQYSNIPIGAQPSTACFHGGVLSPSGTVVMVPRNSANIGVFNPTTLALTNVGPIAGQSQTLFGSGVLLPNGNVVMAPLTSGNIGMYNPQTSTFSNVGPVSSAGRWESASLAPNGNVIFAPSSSLNVMVYNPTFVSNPLGAGGLSNIVIGPTEGTFSFRGSALLPSGNIVFCPADASNVGMFDPGTLQYSNCTVVSAAPSKFVGCTLALDGRVVFCPAGSANVGVLNTITPAVKEFCLSPMFNKF